MTCEVCGKALGDVRVVTRTCSARCRKALSRRNAKEGAYELTAEDRAAIAKVLADDADLPPKLDPAVVRLHILANHRRT